MLEAELSGTPYNKARHRQALQRQLIHRSAGSIEFKHANISAALLDLGFPYISGYKPRMNYQALLADVVAARLSTAAALHQIATVDADRPIVVPEVDDILAVRTTRPTGAIAPRRIAEPQHSYRLTTNYVEREARNRSLGAAGELFVIQYERARLTAAGQMHLAAQISHTARVVGDGAGYDVLSFDESGAERLIEVKTTTYGGETPFFVSRNEVQTSEHRAAQYHLYRLYGFRTAPRLYTLPGAITANCQLEATTYLAFLR